MLRGSGHVVRPRRRVVGPGVALGVARGDGEVRRVARLHEPAPPAGARPHRPAADRGPNHGLTGNSSPFMGRCRRSRRRPIRKSPPHYGEVALPHLWGSTRRSRGRPIRKSPPHLWGGVGEADGGAVASPLYRLMERYLHTPRGANI